MATVPKLPAEIDQRELIASELDHKGRPVKELRAWDTGFLEIRTDRNSETRRRIQVWGISTTAKTRLSAFQS